MRLHEWVSKVHEYRWTTVYIAVMVTISVVLQVYLGVNGK